MWRVGFDVKHEQCGGPADQAGFAVVEFDGQGGVGDVDGDGLVLVDPAWQSTERLHQ